MARIPRCVKQTGVYFVTTDAWERRKLFAKPAVADIVLDQILTCREREFYRLHAFVIMPDHVHLMLTPSADCSLEKCLQMIKGGSAFRIGKALNYRFPIWQTGFHDRWMRDAAEYFARLHYVEQNPVDAKLVSLSSEYIWGSSFGKRLLDSSVFSKSQG